jgi:hypothetical protein
MLIKTNRRETYLDLDSAVAAVAFRVTSRLIELLLLFAGAPDQRTEPVKVKNR